MDNKHKIASDLYAFGSFLLDVRRGTLRRGDEPVNLPPKVFETLILLVEQRGEVVSKSVLMKELWPDSFVEESSLTQSIFLLRKTLGKTEAGNEFIENLSKRGYRLAVPVEARRVEAQIQEEGTPATAGGNGTSGGHEAGDEEREFQVDAAPTLLQTSLQKPPRTNLYRWTWALGITGGILALVGGDIALRAG